MLNGVSHTLCFLLVQGEYRCQMLCNGLIGREEFFGFFESGLGYVRVKVAEDGFVSYFVEFCVLVVAESVLPENKCVR